MRSGRLQAVQRRINRFPYRHDAVDNAYARFLDDGTLPEDCSLSGRVLMRVLKARKPQPELLQEQLASRPLWQPYGTTREMLFREACCKLDCVRDLARFMLKCLVEDGYDPTDPEVISPEMEPLDLLPVTVRLLGFPQEYIRPEYQAQWQRVLRQHEELRAYQRMAIDDWDRDAAAALSAFLKHGRMPTESRYLLYVLTIGEQFALGAHCLGKGSEDLVVAYDAVATTTGEERATALHRLGELQARSREAG